MQDNLPNSNLKTDADKNNSTTNASTQSNPVESTKAKSSDSKIFKRLGIAVLTSFVLLVVVSSALVFIPVGAQSSLSNLLDRGGMHTAALAVDNFTNDYSNNSVVYTARDLCKSQTTGYNQEIRLLKIQGAQNISLRPVDSKYENDISFDAKIAGTINADQKATSFQTTAKAKYNNQLTKDENKTKYEGEVNFQNVTTSEATFIKSDVIKFKGDPGEGTTIQTEKKYQDWYKYSFESPSDISKEGLTGEINNIIENVDDILSFKVSDIMTEETYKKNISSSCDDNDAITKPKVEIIVGKPENYNFGQDKNKKDELLRPVTAKFDLDEIYSEQIFKVRDQNNQQQPIFDEKTVGYMKAQKDNFDEIIGSVNKILGDKEADNFDEIYDTKLEECNKITNSREYRSCRIAAREDAVNSKTKVKKPYIDPISDEDFNSAVDSYYESYKSTLESSINQPEQTEEQKKQAEENMNKAKEQLKSFDINLSVVYYIDVETGNPAAFQFDITMKIGDEFLNSQDAESLSPLAKEILKSGIIVSTISYDVQTGDKVREVQIPTESKDIKELVDSVKKEYEGLNDEFSNNNEPFFPDQVSPLIDSSEY